MNYVLFGKIYDLCGLPRAEMTALVWAWKSVLYGELRQETLQWTVAGALGWPYGAPTPVADMFKTCNTDCPKCNLPSFDWTWGGENHDVFFPPK